MILKDTIITHHWKLISGYLPSTTPKAVIAPAVVLVPGPVPVLVTVLDIDLVPDVVVVVIVVVVVVVVVVAATAAGLKRLNAARGAARNRVSSGLR